MLRLDDHRPQDRMQFVGPVHRLYTGNFLGFRLGKFVALPGGNLLTGFPDKQDFFLFFVGGIRANHQHRFFLIDAAQIEDVRLLDERMIAVGTGGHDIIGVENRNRIRLELLAETLPIFHE